MIRSGEEDAVGLCAACRHVRRVAGKRGQSYVLCGLSGTDLRFRKYPSLPVRVCAGFEKLVK